MDMSKRQQKKQVLRDARQERKAAKKTEKQAQALRGALKEVEELLSGLGKGLDELFGRSKYEDLPVAFGPYPEEGLALLESVLIRPEKYNAKFLPQEYSLLHKLWLLCPVPPLVLDVGAGNANCAALAAALLDLEVVCVERDPPRPELRAEELLPPALRARVRRVEADVAELGAAELRSWARGRPVLVVAKHPCGIGVDRTIACALRLSALAEVRGVVIATCCCNKLTFDDFRESRVREFCELNEEALGEAVTPELVKLVDVMSKCSAWRTAVQSLGNAISPEQVEWAQRFEDHLQSLRLQKLRKAFGHAMEVRFAPASCTLQDRCLIATRQPLDPEADQGFVARLRKGALEVLEASGPMDCRPMGLKSNKYDFDYTKD